MHRARASIATLLVYVGLIAVGLAALRVSSRLWAAVGFSLALTALVASIAGLIYRRGAERAFWVGFALFGWTYLIVAFGPSPFNAWRDLLVTTPLLAISEERLLDVAAPKAPVPFPRPRPGPFVELSPWSHWTSTDRSNPFSSDSFNRIGHSLFCLGIAIGGGIFCRLLRDTRVDARPSP